MPRPDASPITYNTVVLEKDTKALTRFNVSDPNMTIIFHVEPSANVSLVLTLAQGLPNQTRSSSTVTLNQTGSVSTDGASVWSQHPGLLWFTPFTLAGFWNVNRRLSLDDNPRDVTANSWGLVYHHRALQFWMGTRSDSEHFHFHDQVFVLAHKGGDVEHRWLPGMCWSSRLLSVCEALLSSASVCCAGGREKHPGAGAVSVQPPHPVRELLLCDAQRRGHISHGRSVCHRVAELRGAGAAVRLFRALPDHPAVGLLLWPQVTLKGQSEECIIISCGRAQLLAVRTTAGLSIIFPTLIKSHLFDQMKMTLLEDNHAGALYNYLISVQTGHRKNAGTTANVSLFLFSSCTTIASIFFSQEIQVKIAYEGWWIHYWCPVGHPEAEWLRGREQHSYPRRSWQACLWERSCWLVPVGHPLPTGRSAKHQAAAR